MAAVLTDEELLAFFSPEDFGEEALLYLGTAEPSPVLGIFDNSDVGVSPGTTLDVGSSGPTFTLRTSDARDARQRDRLEVAGKRYEIADRDDDGTGVTVLRIFEL
ncbi:hypothetical protein [Azospirillum sp. TSH64]|uniref:head-tail joining protein n=1 Tax=Azospirillum sp. TSH64 TaxID=652740 RepID=UPI000D609996|nr:hypothetical protein [Azospirillum sp. TSH64]PWC81256.1 hypothetical protein TSH64_01020 [Azospirillum sp. TSH64]